MAAGRVDRLPGHGAARTSAAGPPSAPAAAWASNLGGGAAATVTLEVLMGRGPAPREPDAYDAREVRKRFGAAA